MERERPQADRLEDLADIVDQKTSQKSIDCRLVGGDSQDLFNEHLGQTVYIYKRNLIRPGHRTWASNSRVKTNLIRAQSYLYVDLET
jgi:hypothetical protein